MAAAVEKDTDALVSGANRSAGRNGDVSNKQPIMVRVDPGRPVRIATAQPSVSASAAARSSFLAPRRDRSGWSEGLSSSSEIEQVKNTGAENFFFIIFYLTRAFRNASFFACVDANTRTK